MVDYWIQIENRPWDVCPNNIDRMTGQNLKDREGKGQEVVTLSSPGSGVVRKNVTMFRPLRKSDGTVDDALILRRYKPPKPDGSDAWTVPDDRKVNPWDINEQDPTDNGTMGTIPGPVIECNVGESVTVHFRNMDMRGAIQIQQVCFPFFNQQICIPFPQFVLLPVESRTHSLHPHGFVFAPTSDGAYPLSPPDPTQSIPAAEAAVWASVGVTGQFKQGDRVPPGGTFTYQWNTLGWPTTAGVWLYHDHSICDEDNVGHGAIGIIVIHNTQDPEEVLTPDVPPFGSPIQIRCFPLPFDVPILPQQLEGLGLVAPHPNEPGMPPMPIGTGPETPTKGPGTPTKGPGTPTKGKEKHGEHDEAPQTQLLVREGNLLLEADTELRFFKRFCSIFYSAPPKQALYLQLFHTLGDASMCINGRKYLGNTPTLIAGRTTKMRFGVVGMGSDFHTFHIHGHRWIIPGPDGTDLNTIQNSVQKRPVSQFEDTRVFGPANSFVFTIHEDPAIPSFMRAEPVFGEWHMHCHVLNHMMTGMMGSLLVIQGGETVTQLPRGKPCPSMPMPPPAGGGGGPKTVPVNIQNFQFNPASVSINVGDTVTWTNKDQDNHTVTADDNSFDSSPGCPGTPASCIHPGGTFSHTFTAAGVVPYHCNVHTDMKGTVNVT